MFEDVGRVLIEREAIDRRVREMGTRLAQDLRAELENEGENALEHPDRIVMVPIMTGAMVFAADLIRQMPLKLSIDLVVVSSYPGQSLVSKGAALKGSLPERLSGRHVVIVDDILDSGRTLDLVRSLILGQNPASLRICVLLDKKIRREVDIEPDYAGFEIPDEFVVGYGLDYDGFFRNVPDIRALDQRHVAPGRDQ